MVWKVSSNTLQILEHWQLLELVTQKSHPEVQQTSVCTPTGIVQSNAKKQKLPLRLWPSFSLFWFDFPSFRYLHTQLDLYIYCSSNYFDSKWVILSVKQQIIFDDCKRWLITNLLPRRGPLGKWLIVHKMLCFWALFGHVSTPKGQCAQHLLFSQTHKKNKVMSFDVPWVKNWNHQLWALSWWFWIFKIII